jgi:hypothetical protein
MSKPCKSTREKWPADQKGGPVDPQEIENLREHLTGCAACREFAYQNKFFLLLKQAGRQEAPEPSAAFYAGLNQKLAEIEALNGKSLLAELITRAGLKLVPALSVALLFLAGFAGYCYKDTAFTGTAYAVDEVILFDDSPVSTEWVLSAVIMDEV